MTDVISIIDTLWVLLAAILVFFMNLGFALGGGGLCPRQKLRQHPVQKLYRLCRVLAGLYAAGLGLMFGGDNPFIGTEHLFVLAARTSAFMTIR